MLYYKVECRKEVSLPTLPTIQLFDAYKPSKVVVVGEHPRAPVLYAQHL